MCYASLHTTTPKPRGLVVFVVLFSAAKTYCLSAAECSATNYGGQICRRRDRRINGLADAAERCLTSSVAIVFPAERGEYKCRGGGFLSWNMGRRILGHGWWWFNCISVDADLYLLCAKSTALQNSKFIIHNQKVEINYVHGTKLLYSFQHTRLFFFFYGGFQLDQILNCYSRLLLFMLLLAVRGRSYVIDSPMIGQRTTSFIRHGYAPPLP